MHRWSQLFIPTLREAPADAEVASHKYLLRAGYVRQLAAGLYSYLFLGQRAMLKITHIVRQEMDRIGQEFYLPALHPAEIWQESGRWQVMGENMFRLKDRRGADLCLGMTEEEVMTSIARRELRSYKQLPQIWYQIQSKFRDEPRPKSGLLRVRQFTMKDSYSFDLDPAGLDVSYQKHYEAYCRIFDRCGLKYVVVEAHSGAMGGSQSHEFMVYTGAGEDLVVSCPSCKYAANLEKATSRLEPVDDYPDVEDGKPLPVHTPGMKTIEEVARFLGVSPRNKMKTLALMATDATAKADKPRDIPIVAFLRGDHSLNEAKLSAAIGAADFRPMHPEEIQEVFGSPAGFLGPIGSENWHYKGIKAKVFVDRALLGRKNLIAGANKQDYHLRNVTPQRDFAHVPTSYANGQFVIDPNPRKRGPFTTTVAGHPTLVSPFHQSAGLLRHLSRRVESGLRADRPRRLRAGPARPGRVRDRVRRSDAARAHVQRVEEQRLSGRRVRAGSRRQQGRRHRGDLSGLPHARRLGRRVQRRRGPHAARSATS